MMILPDNEFEARLYEVRAQLALLVDEANVRWLGVEAVQLNVAHEALIAAIEHYESRNAWVELLNEASEVLDNLKKN